MVDLQQFADVQEFKRETLFKVALLCALDPDNISDVTAAAYSGVKAHADDASLKHVTAHNAMVAALALMNQDRVTADTKIMLNRAILNVTPDGSAAMREAQEKARKIVEG